MYTINRKFTIISLLLLALLVIPATALADDIIVIQAETVVIHPGQDIQDIIDSKPDGTVYVFAPGYHRMQTITPNPGDSFIGQQGAVLSGARLLTNFEREGNLWVATGQTQQGRVHRVSGWQICEHGYNRCAYPEDLYFNSQPLLHVGSKDQVEPGKWFFDYGNDRIYFADDPTGKTVETSVTPYAFEGKGHDNVTIRDLTIEKFATPAQSGALHAQSGENWIVDNVISRLNHGAGITTGPGMRVTNSFFNYNGQLGIHGRGDNLLIENVEIAYNNYAFYNYAWEAGGTKFSETNNLVARNNRVFDNHGAGLWTDIDNINTLYENNYVVNNSSIGIFHEISYAAVIRNNIVEYNNHGGFGGQIYIATSSDVQAYNNRIVVGDDQGDGIVVLQQDRGNGIYGVWESRNNYVHNNTVIFTAQEGWMGTLLYQDNAPNFWRDSTNRFDYNTYSLPGEEEGNHQFWVWGEERHHWEGMRGHGQEANGRIIFDVPPSVNNLRVEGDLSTPPIVPTFHWAHFANESDTSVPAERYLLTVERNGTKHIEQWYDAATSCNGTDCAAAPGVEFTNGGTYDWKVESWTQANGIGESASSTFEIDLSVPGQMTGVTVESNQGRPLISFVDDPDALWYQVYIGSSDYSNTVHMQWYEKTGNLCGNGRCQILTEAWPTNGDYVIHIRAWGQGGFGDGGVNGWSEAYDMQVSYEAPAVVVQLGISSNEQPTGTFSWNGSNGASWYQLWVGTPGPEFETHHMGWYNIQDLGCSDAGMCYATPGLDLPAGEYIWYVRSWGPGGFSTGGANGWAEGTPFTRQ